MAEFKLGRIRFVWQGDWATGTTYVADDVVSFGGKSYICIKNHTASAEFNIDFEDAIPKWDIVSDGTSWKGDWEPEVEYAPGDVVRYGANVYIAENGHTSATYEAPTYLGLEENLDDWTEFATSFDWKGNWTNTTRYKINDLVRYGGYVYVCNTAHVSAATDDSGLEADQGKWTLFSDGIVYTGEWTTTTRYRVNDLVKFGGNIWIATSAHTSTNFEADEANWDSFIEGFQFEDSWNSISNYQIGDTVTYGGYIYVAKENNTNSQPTSNPLDWDVFTTGFKFQGDWSVLTEYRVGDVVRLGGATYVALLDNDGQEPPENTYWSKLNSGINWTNSTESFLQVTGTIAAGGSGSGARFDVTKSGTVYTVGVSTGFAGTGYAENDVITIAGSSVGGTVPANNITITVTGVTAGAIDTITWVGNSSTWKTGTLYHVGDVVFYGANSYIAVTKHTSETSNRPDNDSTAAYWNLLTLGSESLALTTEGDLVYYGETGPTRLPIGIDGQILRVTDGAPAWANYGLIDNVVYVGPLGTDVPAPASGLTIDKPWASVRYAMDQVRKGYLNPQARDIIRNNKEFLMKEVTNWIDYTYSVLVTASTAGAQTFTCADTSRLDPGMPIVFNGTLGGVTAGTIYYVDVVTSPTKFRISTTQNSGIPLTLTTASGYMNGELAYDKAKCERDTGYIIEALAYDISRGGTLKTVTAANEYYTPAGNLYINNAFGSQKEQTVAANEYLKEIVATVLSNQQPLNFQSLNGISVEDRAVQIIDLSLEAESDAVTKAATLMDIIINGISAGSANAIPPATNPNTTVFLKTGTYNEVLPIIIPEYTAIVGDELRTSVVQPQQAIADLINDKDKTIGSLNRINALVPDLLQNKEVSVTSGNTEAQQFINGFAGTTTATDRMDVGTGIIADVLANGIEVGEAYEFTNPIPTSGTGNASDSGYANAVAQLTANKAFIQNELTAWIQDQIDGNIAPFTTAFTYDAIACERDVGYIVDALIYDLTYGGNLETTVAARSYFVNGSAVYGTGEKDEVLAANARLKTVIGEVILETLVTTSLNTTEAQNLDGDPGSVAAQTQAEALVQELYDTIDNDGTLATESTPDITWVPAALTTANTNILAAKTDIQNAVIDYINTNYGEFKYDGAKCRRDAGLLKTGAAYDIALNTNYNAIRDGLAYRRRMSVNVLENELTQTVGAITEEGSLVEALMSDATAISRNSAYWTEVIDIIENNTADAISWSSFTAGSDTGRTEIQTNRALIISALTTWIDAQVTAGTAPFTTTYEYNASICERDAGYILDAISYDIQYTGNSATVEAARAYFDGYASVLPVGQRQAEVAALEQLATIVKTYLSNSPDQDSVDTLMAIITTVVNAGSLSTLATKTYPDYTGITSAIETDVDAILADTTVVPDVLQYITDTYSGFVYNHAKCSRDIGYIIDALRYDIMFGSDFRSLKSGMAYRRGLASTGVVTDNQLEATLGAIEHTRDQIKEITSGSSDIKARAEEIRDIMISGTAPTSFTFTDPTGYDTGFFNARRLIVANKQFLIDEVEAYMTDNYGSLWTSIGAGGQAACLRDMGYIVDALQYDLTYRGNLETIVAARSYYSQGVFVEPSNEKAAALAVQARLADIIDNIATGDTGGWTKSSSNGSTQDTTGTAGSAGAAAFAVDRINEIYNTIDTGDEPALISPSTAWIDSAMEQFKSVVDARKSIIQSAATAHINYVYPDLVYDQDLCARDVGYIIDAIAYDVIFGSNFRSAKAGMSYLRGISSTQTVLADQLEPSIDTIEFIEASLLELTNGVEGSVGTTFAADRAASLAADMQQIIANGLESVPALELPVPPVDIADLAFATTTNTTGEYATYADAADQLAANRAFIQDEVRTWLEDSGNGYDTFWATISADGQDRCIRDVGYIIDAIRYDLTYGGNTQSLVAGSAYYSNLVLTIDSSELPATLAAYARMKDVIGWVIAEDTGSWTKTTALTQDVSGTAGNAYAVEFAEDRVDDILDWINNGEANATIEIATKWADNDLQEAYNRLVSRRTEIREDVVYWVEKFHQELRYNQDLCRRDAGLMVDAIARDLLTGSNFATIKAGISYYRLVESTAEVRNDELDATLGAVNFLKHKVRHVAATTVSGHVSLLIDDIANYIHGGKQPTVLKFAPVDATADTADLAAASIIWDNKAFIQAEVQEFLDAEYGDTIEYSKATCMRDVGYMIDALRYDLTYGGNSATNEFALSYYQNAVLVIDENDKEATIRAFDYMKFLCGDLAINTLGSPYALQEYIAPKFRDEASQEIGDAGSKARVESIIDNVKLLVDQGELGLPVLTMTDITSNVITTSEEHGLVVNDQIYVGSLEGVEPGVYFVESVPSTTTLTLAEFFNGSAIELVDDAAPITDLITWATSPTTTGLNTTLLQQGLNLTGAIASLKTSIIEYIADNYPTLTYDEEKCSRDVGLIINAVLWDMLLDSNYRTTVAANAYYRGTQADLVLGEQRTATVQSYRELKNLAAAYVSNTGLSNGNQRANPRKRVNKLMDIIINMLDRGNGDTPELNGTITYLNDVATIKGADILNANKNFLANEATAWVKDAYGITLTGANGTNLSFDTAHMFTVNDPIVFDTTSSGFTAGVTYYVASVVDTLTITVAATMGGTAIETTGQITGTPVITYSFDEDACKRDMIRYIEAIVYDLQYPGNHKVWKAAELYLNAVNGSERSDMYRVRNSTGVRNQTLNGLRGNLTEENDFGTRRPTAGAYVALDPGFGPNDSEAWITNKSPYIQNVTTFGVGCVGNKIDGALHSGGNRSMVSNDFTQVLSDGIGVWCSGNNSLTELVSVFAYYNYSGYLADFGGRIRATNGNSSYGTWGTIAEGTDTGEVPLYCTVDNLSTEAFITNVNTDGESVLNFEFANAGVNYTNAEYAISGDGFNGAVIADEFRDQGIFEVRLVDLDDANGVGGADYVTAKNVGQGGDATYIQLAATDTALANAYNGMHVQITAGSGVGQYAKVLRFNNGTKNATVYKPSFNNVTVTDTSATGNVITISTLDTTSQLYVGMPVYFSADVGGLSEGVSPTAVYYVESIIDNNNFTVSDTDGGAAVTLTNTSSQSVTMYAAGWDHVVPGTPVAAGLDLTTGYTIEPSLTFTAPGFTGIDTTTDATVAYQATAYADGRFYALQNGGTGVSYSTDGETWEAGGSIANANWKDIAFGGGFGARATAIVGGLGGSGAILEAELGELNSIGLPGPTQVARINVIDGGNGYTTPPTITITPTSGGGAATAICTVLNGTIQEVIVTTTGAGYGAAPLVTAETDKITDIIVESQGRNYIGVPTITVTGGGASTQATLVPTMNNGGVFDINFDVDGDENPLVGEGYTSAPTVTITDTNAKFVAIADGSTANASIGLSDAIDDAWTAGNALPASTFESIAFGAGTWTAVGGTAGGATSTDGATWVSRTLPTLGAGTYSGVAYGMGTFVAVATGTNASATSSNGITWAVGGNMPAVTTWSDIAYGNGRFVAIATGGRSAAVSYDKGATWVASPAGLPSSQDWSRIAYGQGLFMAVAEGTNQVATSQDGVTWTAHILNSSDDWSGVVFGNPNNIPTWVAVTNAANNTATKIKTGAKAIVRTAEADGSLNSIRVVEPVSGYPAGSVTATNATGNVITVDSTDNMIAGQQIKFRGLPTTSNMESEAVYYIDTIPSSTTITVSLIKDSGTAVVQKTETFATAGTFITGPIGTLGDPNSTVDAPYDVRQGNGVLAMPSFTNRGTGYQTASAELGGDGSSDLFQSSTFIAVKGLFDLPEPGSNVEFATIPGTWYKLVAVTNVIGIDGDYTATFQISPGLEVINAPLDGTLITTTNKYSQVRLTGHDFLYIGTGNQAETNYPYVDITTALQSRQYLGSGGGRVFFTSTDQDGNFNVGDLFGVQQSTGTATLDADAFNLAGLQSLQLNGIGLGIGSAIITQFSTDPFFTANSDSIVPTQRAIKSYITAQIGGGQSSLNVNTLTAGVVFIANDEITTTSGGQLNIKAKMNFTGGIDGAPVALGYFLAR
jgi:hypothetical protein